MFLWKGATQINSLPYPWCPHRSGEITQFGGVPEHKRNWEKKEQEKMFVARRDQGILRRAVDRYKTRLHRRLKRLFLDTQRYLRGICCNPKSRWRLLDEKQDWRKRAVLELHRGQKDLWTLITMSITILEVPTCVALTEFSFSDSEGNTCNTTITPVLAHILLGIWLKLLLEDVNRIYSRVNKSNNKKLF